MGDGVQDAVDVMDVTGIQQMLSRRSAALIKEIERLKTVGDQAGIDALIQYVHCPQEVSAHEVGDDWTSLWCTCGYTWKERAWIRDHLVGRFALYTAHSGDPDYELRFENAEDAFAFKMRWL